MPKFRKKPVVIDAEQFYPEKKPWPDGVKAEYQPSCQEQILGYRVTPSGGRMWVWVDPGDWIITGVKGEKYPCRPEIFEMTYEQVEK